MVSLFVFAVLPCLLTVGRACAADLERQAVFVTAPTGERLRAVLRGGDMDGCGVLRGAAVALLDDSGATVWDEFRRDWNPWLLRVGHFGGREVLLVGVRKPAPMDPVERVRPFLFTVRPHGLGLQKAWLGTSLSRPFLTVDFGNVDGTGEDELVALERTREGVPTVRAYRWRGFGIEGVADSPPLPGADDLRCGDVLGDGREEAVVRIVTGQVWRFVALGLDRDSLEVTDEVRATVGKSPAQWALQTEASPRGVVLIRGQVRRVLPFSSEGRRATGGICPRQGSAGEAGDGG
jgi:hypothetical protein